MCEAYKTLKVTLITNMCVSQKKMYTLVLGRLKDLKITGPLCQNRRMVLTQTLNLLSNVHCLCVFVGMKSEYLIKYFCKLRTTRTDQLIKRLYLKVCVVVDMRNAFTVLYSDLLTV